jgi:kynurenine formamidase
LRDIEPPSKFIGETVVVDLSEKCNIGEGITCSDLEAYSKVIKDTGTSEYWMKDQNIKYDFTYIEPSAAQWIVNHHVKCIGIDTFSVEKYGSKEGLSHKILLSGSVGIIQNLNSNVKNLTGKKVWPENLG